MATEATAAKQGGAEAGAVATAKVDATAKADVLVEVEMKDAVPVAADAT